MHDVGEWAEAEFGDAKLGDSRRTRALVRLGGSAARRPSGIVSRTCVSSAMRESAFRLLENPDVHVEAIRQAVCAKTAEDCRGLGVVIVPVDATVLSLDDETGSKGLGHIGPARARSRGLHVMSALALARNGTPIGLAAQEMWVRNAETDRNARRRGDEESEGCYWNHVVQATTDEFADRGALPWFQMDRGADSASILLQAIELGALATIRARADRLLDSSAHLWSTLERAPVRAEQRLKVNAGKSPIARKHHRDGKISWSYSPPRKARVAKLVIRAAQVTLDCPTNNGKQRVDVPMNVVFVREVGRLKNERIEWMLLTTHPIATKKDVLAVIRAYALRWRIEDFHRAWKDGLCRVEDMKLRSRDAIAKWSTILAAVAIRAMRLTHLARQTPHALASTEFSEYELEAIFLNRQPKDFDKSLIPTMTLEQAIRWIADTAGYNGPWKGPPGATIVGRGLYEIEVIARALEARGRTKKR